MGDRSDIEWTEATWNPTTGCTKVSPGCKFCYAKHKAWPRLSKNRRSVYYGRKFEDVQVHPERLDQPLRWRKPRRIFVNSMSDLFHEDIQDEFIEEVFAVMALADRHIFQVLTKRPERMRDFLATEHRWVTIEGRAQRMYYDRTGDDPSFWMSVKLPLPNVWLGVSVENQETADARIPILTRTPAAIRWLSCEPLLESIDLRPWIGMREQDILYRRRAYPPYGFEPLHWIVVGGESGKGARPMREQWALQIRDHSRYAGIPFFMKQGSQANWPHWKDFDRWPDELRVRQYPIVAQEAVR